MPHRDGDDPGRARVGVEAREVAYRTYLREKVDDFRCSSPR